MNLNYTSLTLELATLDKWTPLFGCYSMSLIAMLVIFQNMINIRS